MTAGQHQQVSTARLDGKVALVTGAGRGIGRGIAIELGSRGASVVVNYANSSSAAEEVVKEIEKHGSKAIAIQANVSQVEQIGKLFEQAVAHFGHLDIVVSNSGMESFDKIEDVTPEKYDKVFGLNARGQFFVGQAAFNHLTPGGRLVLTSSIAAGLLGVEDHALYSGSKSAVEGFTKSFATDFAKRKGITVNAIAPGGIKTDMFTHMAWRYIPGATKDWTSEQLEKSMAGHCPMQRCAVPQDVARVVAFLASEDGGWVNGECILRFCILPFAFHVSLSFFSFFFSL
ncbi:NAD(P)-binding protein [Xylona heveae TC161]|uniref:NAD(P)-binding protein n=1 Tax=Xylona heveae (strain CBS 132557 / TC161) TaxID=1328760 RepID=A0A165ABG5_XYLHT|nr:NAD(P)-binding protein [Xylona heveae TC161]KZF20211.1 NAD(P)-binding protein [Xylona heveae TC161]